MRFKVIVSDKEFDDVKGEWLDFERKVGNQSITTGYVWQRTWWKHFRDYEDREFGYKKKLCILFLYDKENVLQAIAPFCEITRRAKGIEYRAVEFVAQQWGATYLDIISEKLGKEEMSFIAQWLAQNRKYDLLELKYIPEFSTAFDFSKTGFTVMTACPEIKTGDYEGMEQYQKQAYAISLKKTLRNSRNRIKKEGLDCRKEVFDRITPEHFREIEELSRSKTIDDKHSVYNNARKKNFLQDLYGNPELASNLIRVTLNDKIVAYGINFFYGRRKYYFDASFDRSYRHFDVGVICYDFNIEDSFARKIPIHCAGTGLDRYKLRFSRGLVRDYCFLEAGNTLKAKMLQFLKKWHNRKTEAEFSRAMGTGLPEE